MRDNLPGESMKNVAVLVAEYRCTTLSPQGRDAVFPPVARSQKAPH
jgi:hypothetical protein